MVSVCAWQSSVRRPRATPTATSSSATRRPAPPAQALTRQPKCRLSAVAPHRLAACRAAALPLQLAHAADQGRLRPGTPVVLFGMASGASGSVMLISW
ncbi:3-oxoacyl-[acyl-carrier-protein] synthase III C-terminal domain-containing protein [Streptomyces sp. NPDC102476]|uniref:3-oxoacyl-[acyl-carrier-protein] synthase III C-terminal domain-containing protein n=1 Tax=Streptomyces sp. NPDC102476 TaxID=3366181 RepID=UPI0038015C6B